MKKLRHIINALVWVLIGLYVSIMVMANIPMIQSAVGNKIASMVGEKLGTEVHIGKVNVVFNRIIVDDVSILDQRGKHLLRSTRMSAKISYLDLLQGRIFITSAQLFGLDANLYKADKTSRTNFQFVIDSLQSKDTTKHEPVRIAINSLIIRHGKIAWNQLDMPRKMTFDTNHISLNNISSHIIINVLGGDSINVNIKKLAFLEHSGIQLSSLSLKATANKNAFNIKDVCLALPHSQINIPSAIGEYPTSASYKVTIAESHVLLSELAPFVKQLDDKDRSVVFNATLTGSNQQVSFKHLTMKMPTVDKQISMQSASDISLSANGLMDFSRHSLQWNCHIANCTVNAKGLEFLVANHLPEALSRLQSLQFTGVLDGNQDNVNMKVDLLSDAGNATIIANKQKDHISGHLHTESFNLGQVLDNKQFGLVATDIASEGNIKSKEIEAKGKFDRFDYNKYSYHDINLDGYFAKDTVKGKLNISDPNLVASIEAAASVQSKVKSLKVNGDIGNIYPSKLGILRGRLAEASYAGKIDADFTGSNINDVTGYFSLVNFTMKSSTQDYSLDSLHIRAKETGKGHFVGMKSDFGNAVIYGRFNYANIPQVVQNIIISKLPSLHNLISLKYKPIDDNFSIVANINRSDWAKAFFGLPLDIRDTLKLSTDISNEGKNINATIAARDLIYAGHQLRDINAKIKTVNNQLQANVALTNVRNKFVGTDLNLTALAGNDRLQATLAVDNHASKDRLRGTVSSLISFYKNDAGRTHAKLDIQKSSFSIGDTLFNVHPSTVIYSKNHLAVNSFAITSGSQSVLLDGVASTSGVDSLTAVLHNVDVGYILNLVNFHSVKFSGAASGTACVSQLFGKPAAKASLRVDDFRLIGGRLGTLNAQVNWNAEESQIDINAVANDTIGGEHPKPRRTLVKGYVSPQRNYIDLGITLKDTRAELVKNLCSSFLGDMNLTGNGNLRVWGDLKKINLTGKVIAHGSTSVKPLGTRYNIPYAVVNFTENEIQFANDSIYDSNGNLGIIEGAIHHQHLGRMTYNLGIEARNLLAFNFDGSDGSSFYGKVFGTGKATIKGRSGEVDIDVDMRPEQTSEVIYDISSPEAVGAQNFIQWVSRDSMGISQVKKPLSDADSSQKIQHTQTPGLNIPADIRLSLLIDAHPDATLRLITDKASGDYITLNGSGTLRATYFNKGGVDIFGTYTIDHGIYKLTIQNIIKRVFEFTNGGTIVFGGDPYNAILNMKAQYPIASVSLSDLQVGRSFSSNNVRVNCIMDITGTPSSPKVDFNLDFPSLNQDQQQMISSVINGEEEMNQQVLYLLAIGRFYSRGVNNAGTQSYNQTSLAMQSILSGELSQQINNVLGVVVKNNDWNFGANISTGDEGWNNAEYEGILSGRLLNNRLLINGQFGYRDNATQSFIGDFDVRYLIVPSGNFNVHVYNKTNDRYFTRNSLNTQGIGFILKKDFSSLRDLLGIKKKKVKASPSHQ